MNNKMRVFINGEAIEREIPDTIPAPAAPAARRRPAWARFLVNVLAAVTIVASLAGWAFASLYYVIAGPMTEERRAWSAAKNDAVLEANRLNEILSSNTPGALPDTENKFAGLREAFAITDAEVLTGRVADYHHGFSYSDGFYRQIIVIIAAYFALLIAPCIFALFRKRSLISIALSCVLSWVGVLIVYLND